MWEGCVEEGVCGKWGRVCVGEVGEGVWGWGGVGWLYVERCWREGVGRVCGGGYM